MDILVAALFVNLLGFATQNQAPGNAGSCDRLSALLLPHTRITVAQPVPAGDFVVTRTGATEPQTWPNLPAFCRVVATLEPSADSDINIEVWMPAANWNGKFQAVGNGAGRERRTSSEWHRRYAMATRRRPQIPGTQEEARRSRSGIQKRLSTSRFAPFMKWP